MRSGRGCPRYPTEKDKAWAELKENVVQLSLTWHRRWLELFDQEAHERLIQDTLAKLDESQLGESVWKQSGSN